MIVFPCLTPWQAGDVAWQLNHTPAKLFRMTFTPVNEIERLLVAAATDPAARPAFYRGLSEHDLFVITEGRLPEREGQVISDANMSIQIRMIELEGKPHAPVFTSARPTDSSRPCCAVATSVRTRTPAATTRARSSRRSPRAVRNSASYASAPGGSSGLSRSRRARRRI